MALFVTLIMTVSYVQCAYLDFTLLPLPVPDSKLPTHINAVSAVPGAFYAGSELKRLENLRNLAIHYDIKIENAMKLQQLKDFSIMVVCDDSVSMSKATKQQMDRYGQQETRWSHLSDIVSMVVDLGTALTPRGVDVFFLNNTPGMIGVKSWVDKDGILHSGSEHIRNTFRQHVPLDPSGTTSAIHQIWDQLVANARKKVLMIMATDGEGDVAAFLNYIHCAKPTNLHISIVACTDGQGFIDHLSSQTIPNLDVTEEFGAKRADVRKKKGRRHPYSFGDYVVKIMLGSVDSSLDDEGIRHTKTHKCTIL